jgi:DNA polymerase III subunit gamma/tau
MYSLVYRPKTFNDVFGHSSIVNEFKNRSKENNNFADVMILSGNSGSGKTTSAFIIAKLLNCKNPVKQEDGHFEPCNCCESCKDINEERFARDIYFKDASQMGKAEVIDLNNIANQYPMYDKNLIFIIDEAQNLGVQAKGATLKLLEKQRKNVYFILCTMSFDSFPNDMKTAIKRRSQFYNFKEVPIKEIALYLRDVLKKENLYDKVPDSFIKCLFFIAENSNGSPGLAVSYLERCIMGELYTEERILEELNLVTDSTSSNILLKLLRKDSSAFKDLRQIGLEEFYLKSCKILREAMIYSQSGWIDQDWKEDNAKRLSKDKNELMKLINVFYGVSYIPYFNENSFYVELIKYFFDEKVEKVETDQYTNNSESNKENPVAPIVRRRVLS